MEKIKILFVCMGNICRSPTAQGVFESLVEQHRLSDHVEVDSAGTHAYHVGEKPDPRAIKAAARRGIDLEKQRARQVQSEDFERFDFILAMDSSNLDDLHAICPEEYRDRVRLLLEFAEDASQQDVPDPYYGGSHGFDRVLDLVEKGARGLLQAVREHRERLAGQT